MLSNDDKKREVSGEVFHEKGREAIRIVVLLIWRKLDVKGSYIMQHRSPPAWHKVLPLVPWYNLHNRT